MTDSTTPTEYRIFLEEVPARLYARAIPAGYYGQPPGLVVSMNRAIYCRVPTPEAAWTTSDRHTAIRAVTDFLDKGYPARCIPPITVTY